MAVEFVAEESMVLAVESVAVGSVVLAGESGVVEFEAVELLADLVHLKSKSNDYVLSSSLVKVSSQSHCGSWLFLYRKIIYLHPQDI